MLKKIKLTVLLAADSLGVSKLALSSYWRRQKLLILCYHGISLADEHEWDGSLYMSPALFRSRLEQLQKAGCTVLALPEAIRALYAGELPPRAVAITFDDGFYDFYARAMPLAKEFGYPLTVYLTTYYICFNRPVFDPALQYILWKSRGRTLTLPEASVNSVVLTDESRRSLNRQLYQYVTEQQFTGQQKDEFLQRLAHAAGGIAYENLREKRLLHLMTPEEVVSVGHMGADVQLHTHRHRVSNGKEQFQREIADNRERIEEITHQSPTHFCYPSGFFLPDYPEWLREMKVESATTCIPGIAGPSTSPLMLPRLVDTSTLTAVEFGGWVSGLASLLPQRKFQMDQRSYIAE